MTQNRPKGRERNVTGTAKVEKHGEGLGIGPVGTQAGAEAVKKLAELLLGKRKK